MQSSKAGWLALVALAACSTNKPIQTHMEWPATASLDGARTTIDCTTNEADTSLRNSSVLHGCVSNKLAQPVITIGGGTSDLSAAVTAAAIAAGGVPMKAKPAKPKKYGFDVESSQTIDEAIEHLHEVGDRLLDRVDGTTITVKIPPAAK